MFEKPCSCVFDPTRNCTPPNVSILHDSKRTILNLSKQLVQVQIGIKRWQNVGIFFNTAFNFEGLGEEIRRWVVLRSKISDVLGLSPKS